MRRAGLWGPRPHPWGSFLRNHDEVDLGRLTQAERLVDVMQGERFAVPREGACEIKLDSYGYRWFRVSRTAGC